MQDIKKLPGIGAVNAQKLSDAGIDTPEQLRTLGSREAFLMVRRSADPGACLHFLYGLEAAVQGIPKKELPEADRAELRAFFAAQEKAED